MAERRRRERVEVRRAHRDEVPVGDVGERRRAVTTDIAEAGRVRREAGRDADDREEQDQRGQEAPDAAFVERAQVDAAVRVVLVQEYRRDEVAGQHEEDVDTEPTAAQLTRRHVIHHDRRHRDSAEAVERRNAPLPDGLGAAARARAVVARHRSHEAGFCQVVRFSSTPRNTFTTLRPITPRS